MNTLNVFYHNKKVGTLKIDSKAKIYFQYDEDWVKKGFSISPIKLPLCSNVFESNCKYSNGLFGVFADSFVDSWGELLIRRYLLTKNIDYDSLNILEKLSYIGKNGMGALEYKPANSVKCHFNLDLDSINESISKIVNNKECNDIDNIFSLGGSSGGTRPKILVNYKGRDSIVKFASRFDDKNIAEQEFLYMSKAKQAGINIPYIELIETSKHKYFSIERFDRFKQEKIHMISVSGLLEVDHNVPSLDYLDLLKLTRLVTRNEDDVIEMYRRMVFNVVFENKDDHTKNFAFLYNEESGMFSLSPAFDLTPGNTYFGEHTTSVNGKGKDITEEDMLIVAKKTRINLDTAKQIINIIKDIKKSL